MERRPPYALDGWNYQANQNRDDGNDHQEFDERKCASGVRTGESPQHSAPPLCGTFQTTTAPVGPPGAVLVTTPYSARLPNIELSPS